MLESKLSPAVLAHYDCWTKRAQQCKLSPDGTIKIQLFLTSNPATVLDQLKAAGLQLSQVRPKEKTVIATLPLEKLIALAKIDTVKFVALVRR